jgi:hypothetical protein
MANIRHIKLLRNPESRQSLIALFDSEQNPQACKFYAGGDLCTIEHAQKRVEAWGKRAEENLDGLAPYIVLLDEKPVALLNIGNSETVYGAPSVINRRANTKVAELGFFVADRIWKNSDLGIPNGLFEDVASYIAENILAKPNIIGYGKAFVTFNPENPYAVSFWRALGGVKLSCSNVEKYFGDNAINPERAVCENDQLLLCRNWETLKFQNPAQNPVQHAGWNNDLPTCSGGFGPREAMIVPIGDLSTDEM